MARLAVGGRRVIIVDTALRAREEQGSPIRVGMVGAGFMGQGLANQIVNSVPGMRMVAVSNRTPERAGDVFRYAGSSRYASTTQAALEDAFGRPAGLHGRPVAALPQRAGRRRLRGHR